MLELVTDPEILDSSKWPYDAPAGTVDVSGGRLNLIDVWGCNVDGESYDAIIGAEYYYDVEVASFIRGVIAIYYGGVVIWTSADGAGTFAGSIVATTTDPLLVGASFGATASIEGISVMADSIRELILQSLETQMKVMTTANGYDFNVASTSVVRARRFFEESDLPAIGIFDGDETLAYDFNDTRADMQVRVELHADAGATNRSTVLNKMKANLEKCIMSQDTTHSSLAGGSRINGMEMRLPDDDDSTLLTVAAIALIQYTTVTGNPYSQPS